MTFSQRKTYLVTGAAGFIGSRFVESCNSRGIQLISVDKESHFQDRKENQGLIYGQIVDRDHLLTWLSQNRPSIQGIFHLGAITDTRETDLDRLQKLNLEYSQALWTYAAQERLPFIYASSAATYGDGSHGYQDQEEEISKLQPLNAYGWSKQNFDLWALDQEKNGIKPPCWAGFKFFNVYGYGERHKDFMSSVVLHAFDQIQAQGNVTLFKSHKEGIEDGHQKRDFVFVEDVVDVLHFALNNPIPRGIYNLGSGKARTFIDLARAVFSALKKPEQIQFIDTPLSIRDKYQYFTEANMDKLRHMGYYSSFTSLEEGVRQYVERLMKL
jgi:ADP-L-glycero-D-manno-heptose 6-epimerase